jgi:sulfate transport system ATP-binding protein
MNLHLQSLRKLFGSTVALNDIDLDVRSGELVALLGPSGSGKTTLLRAIAGLLPVDSGRILFGERDATSVSLRDRRVGFVFQHYALFKHLDVFENIAFGLRSRPRRERPQPDEITRRVNELLARVQLADLGKRLPDQLSGGQRQRVALARAMAIDPTVLLLDEPFGALDAKVRVELRRWLRQIHDDTGYTTLFVTHDQEEAMELADRVVVLDGGRIVQVGTPDEIYQRPASAFVFDFIGRGAQIAGQVEAGKFRPTGSDAMLPIPDRLRLEGPALMSVRPHDLQIVAPEAGGLRGQVRQLRTLAGRTTLDVELTGAGLTLEVDLASDALGQLPPQGSFIHLAPSKASWFAAGAQL